MKYWAKSDSLKNTQQFNNVYKSGKYYANKYLVMYVLENDLSFNRVGISVSKKVGNSVVRHRLTRLVRESYRLHEEIFNNGLVSILIHISGIGLVSKHRPRVLLRAYICWDQLWHARLSTYHAESSHLGFCSLLYSQFTTIVSASRADSVINVVSATVRAECQCWHFSFVMCTTFRLSGVRLSSFWMCHSCLLFLIVIFNLII